MELTTSRWDVQVFLSKQARTSHAVGRMSSSHREHVSRSATARLSLDDHVDVAKVDEQLLHVAESDVEALVQS